MARLRCLLLLATAGFWPIGAQAQRLGGGEGADISIARVLAALAICLAAAFALVLVVASKRNAPLPLSRFGWLVGANAGPRIEVIETRRLSPFADLCLVRCDGTEYLLLCGQSSQSVLNRAGPDIQSEVVRGDAR